ncbi:hypothetical protein [Moraxella equi]|uniref:hypothetical protein n=1 Tax=Moraxella equi TaxID=60442 RepID=UPI00117C2C05|nr:hypothetical protein [Moraxella equi]
MLYSQNPKTATSCKVRNTHRFGLDLLMVRGTHLTLEINFMVILKFLGYIYFTICDNGNNKGRKIRPILLPSLE